MLSLLQAYGSAYLIEAVNSLETVQKPSLGKDSLEVGQIARAGANRIDRFGGQSAEPVVDPLHVWRGSMLVIARKTAIRVDRIRGAPLPAIKKHGHCSRQFALPPGRIERLKINAQVGVAVQSQKAV